MSTVVTAPPHTALGVKAVVNWHLLSLDAPCVAALWTCFFAWQFHTPLRPIAPLALAIAVWVLYVLDRVHDADQGDTEQDRHRFHLMHRSVFLRAAFAALAVLITLLFFLPSTLSAAWLWLSVPLALYVCAVHLLRLHRIPKEPLVAAFFTTAVAMPVFVAGSAARSALLVAALMFGAACWLNCAAIARWEGTLLQADPVTAYLGSNLRLGAWLLVLLMVPALLNRQSVPIALAAFVTGACLVGLNGVRTQLEPPMLRALADAALLTPVAVWPVVAWLRLR